MVQGTASFPSDLPSFQDPVSFSFHVSLQSATIPGQKEADLFFCLGSAWKPNSWAYGKGIAENAASQ